MFNSILPLVIKNMNFCTHTPIKFSTYISGYSWLFAEYGQFPARYGDEPGVGKHNIADKQPVDVPVPQQPAISYSPKRHRRSCKQGYQAMA